MERQRKKRLYDKKQWRIIRRNHLRQNPFCVMCEAMGRVTVAEVADHIVPHRGDGKKFWLGTLQSLCNDHHSSAKQSEEQRGYSRAIGPEGYPIDSNHPFYLSRLYPNPKMKKSQKMKEIEIG